MHFFKLKLNYIVYLTKAILVVFLKKPAIFIAALCFDCHGNGIFTIPKIDKQLRQGS